MTDWNPEAVFGIDGLLVELAWKSSLILGMAGLLHLLMQKRAPIAISTGWNAVLIALVILPFGTGIAPFALDYASGPAFNSDVATAPVVETGPRENVGPLTVDSSGDMPVAAQADVPLSHTVGNRPVSRFPLVFAVYLTGVFLCGVRLLLSFVRMFRLLALSSEVDESPWTDAVSRWRSQLGFERIVRVRRSSLATVPFAAGVFRPVVVVPDALIESSDRHDGEVVILHELTHIVRRDNAWHYLLKFLQIVYWWQPLVWVAGRPIAEVRERVCDLFCVETLGNRERYADVLLSIAQSISRRADLSVGLGMARVPRIAGRLEEIAVAPGLKAPGPSRRLSAGGLLVTVCATIILAAGVVDVAAQPNPTAAVPTPPNSGPSEEGPVQPVKVNEQTQLDDDELKPSDAELQAQAEIGRHFTLNKNGAAVSAVLGGHVMTPDLLGHLSKLTNLRTLYLHKTKIPDTGIENLQSLTRLRKLYLGQSNFGDSQLSHLKGLTQLEYLSLGETEVSSAGLQYIKELTRLRILGLDKTRVTDTGLEHLRGLRNLELLTLQQTQVTDEGVRKLQQALPGLVILGNPEWEVENPDDAKQLSVVIAIPERDSTRSTDLREPGSHFNVVVTNRTNRDLRLWETWNSWGYYNLSFDVLDDAGNVQYSIIKKPRGWTRNFATWVNIKPGEHFTLPVDFNPDVWTDSVSAGRDKRDAAPFLARFSTSSKFELKLRAVFRIYPGDRSIDHNIWTGTVRSVTDDFQIHHAPERLSK